MSCCCFKGVSQAALGKNGRTRGIESQIYLREEGSSAKKKDTIFEVQKQVDLETPAKKLLKESSDRNRPQDDLGGEVKQKVDLETLAKKLREESSVRGRPQDDHSGEVKQNVDLETVGKKLLKESRTDRPQDDHSGEVKQKVDLETVAKKLRDRAQDDHSKQLLKESSVRDRPQDDHSGEVKQETVVETTPRVCPSVFDISTMLLQQQCFYVNSSHGNDNNAGDNKKQAWKSFAPLVGVTLRPGDRILIKAGTKNHGCLRFSGSGTEDRPIVVGVWGDGEKPIIDGTGHSAAVHIKDQSHIRIENLQITSQGGCFDNGGDPPEQCGVLIEAEESDLQEGISLCGLEIYDIFTESPQCTSGIGILVDVRQHDGPTALTGVLLKGNNIRRTGNSAVLITGSKKARGRIKGVRILENRVEHVGGTGIEVVGVSDLVIGGNEVKFPGAGTDARMVGRGSGVCLTQCQTALVEKSRFTNARGKSHAVGCQVGDSNADVVIQHNLSLDNAGGFVHILGGNSNCVYRYNVSINDGFRQDGGDGVEEPGRTINISSSTESKSQPQVNRNIYIYNNTIYACGGQKASFAVTSMLEGFFFANNIFHIEGETFDARTREIQQHERDGARPKRLHFRNNVFLHENIWPSSVSVQDARPLLGDVNFQKSGGFDPSSYVPSNADLAGRGQGVQIERVPGDKLGTSFGLDVTIDALGNDVDPTSPGVGAIECCV